MALVLLYEYRPNSALNLDECFRYVSGIMDQVGQMIKKEHEGPYQFDCNDRVPLADRVHTLIVDGITEKYPTHSFLMAQKDPTEKRLKLTDNPTWIISELSGATNFDHHFPYSCISVAFMVRKTTYIAIVFNPIMRLRFWARHEMGAFCNSRRLRIREEDAKPLCKAMVTSEFGTRRPRDEMEAITENLVRVARKAHAVRSLGSPIMNMCLVALGEVDAAYDFGLHVWDMVGAELVIREAGGAILDPSGMPFDRLARRVLVASSAELAQEISYVLRPLEPLPRDE